MLNKEYIKLQLELMNKTYFELKNKLIVKMFEGKKIKFVTIDFDDNDNFVGYKIDYVDDKECLERQITEIKKTICSIDYQINDYNRRDFINYKAIKYLTQKKIDLELEIVHLQERIKQSENEMEAIIKLASIK